MVAALWIAALPQDSKKEYDLTYSPDQPEKGSHYVLKLEEVKDSRFTMRLDGKTLKEVNERKSQSLSADCEILEVLDKHRIKSRWTFAKAVFRTQEEEGPLWFQGRSFRVNTDREAKPQITHDNGGSLISPNLTSLQEALGHLGIKIGDSSKEELQGCFHQFLPSKKMRIGESWVPDKSMFSSFLEDPDLKDAIDATKTETRFTLKTVRSRAGLEYACIEGVGKTVMAKVGALTLDKGIPFVFSMEMEFCISGEPAEESVRVVVSYKGESSATARGKSGFAVDVDIKGDVSLSRKPVQ